MAFSKEFEREYGIREKEEIWAINELCPGMLTVANQDDGSLVARVPRIAISAEPLFITGKTNTMVYALTLESLDALADAINHLKEWVAEEPEGTIP